MKPKLASALLLFCLVSCLALVACKSTPSSLAETMAAQKRLKSYHMTMKGQGKTIQQYVQMKEGKLERMKLETGGGKIMLYDVPAATMHIVDPAKKRAMKMPLNPATMKRGAGVVAVTKGDEPVRGSEDVDGKPCWVIDEKKGDKTRTMWVDKMTGLPRKASDGSREIHFSFDQIDAVPAGTFDLPEGTRVMASPFDRR